MTPVGSISEAATDAQKCLGEGRPPNAGGNHVVGVTAKQVWQLAVKLVQIFGDEVSYCVAGLCRIHNFCFLFLGLESLTPF
jgi:hypothetical protein